MRNSRLLLNTLTMFGAGAATGLFAARGYFGASAEIMGWAYGALLLSSVGIMLRGYGQQTTEKQDD